jgi:hypothetical protein
MKEQVRAAEMYVEDFMRWRTFGFKGSGGYDDQEAEYLDSIEICKMAFDTAENEAREEARRRSEQESKGKGRRRL